MPICPAGIHSDRAAGRDRHHRRPRRPAPPGGPGGPRGARRMDCLSHLHQIGLGISSISTTGTASSSCITRSTPTSCRRSTTPSRSPRSTGKTRSCRTSTRRSPTRRSRRGDGDRRRDDLSLPVGHLATAAVRPATDGTIDGISNRTSYLMNSQLSHKTCRYGRWTLPRFQYEIGLSNFVAFNERDAAGHPDEPLAPATPGRTITTSGWARTSSTPGFPGTGTAARTCCTSTATPGRSSGPMRSWGCIPGAWSTPTRCSIPEGTVLIPRVASSTAHSRSGELPRRTPGPGLPRADRRRLI